MTDDKSRNSGSDIESLRWLEQLDELGDSEKMIFRAETADSAQTKQDEFAQWLDDDSNADALLSMQAIDAAARSIAETESIRALRREVLQSTTQANKAIRPEQIPLKQTRARQENPSQGSVSLFGWLHQHLGAMFATGVLGTGLAYMFVIFIMPQLSVSHSTGIGEVNQWTLDDGSTLFLDTATKVSVEYSKSDRRIRVLEGRIFVEVSKNPQRPFSVETEFASVRAIGTAFSVRKNDGNVSVVLQEGVVAVKPEPNRLTRMKNLLSQNKNVAASEKQLKAGEQWLYFPKHGARVEKVEDMDAQISWRNGKLVFKSAPLIAVVKEVNRYLASPITIRDKALEDRSINAYFDIKNEQNFLRALEALLPVRLDYMPSGEVHIYKK